MKNRVLNSYADGREMAEKADDKKPQISVIVPVHNGQLYLEGCIESIENQAGQTLEVIIVNDGSTDDTVAVCDSLAGAMIICGLLRCPIWASPRQETMVWNRRRASM